LLLLLEYQLWNYARSAIAVVAAVAAAVDDDQHAPWIDSL